MQKAGGRFQPYLSLRFSTLGPLVLSGTRQVKKSVQGDGHSRGLLLASLSWSYLGALHSFWKI